MLPILLIAALGMLIPGMLISLSDRAGRRKPC
jgi:hypothetical protein